MSSRLGRSIDRQQLQNTRTNGVPTIGMAGPPLLPPAPRPVAITAEQLAGLVPALTAQGCPSTYAVHCDDTRHLVWFVAACGPISVPLGLTAVQAREVGNGMLSAADAIDSADVEDGGEDGGEAEAGEETIDIEAISQIINTR